MFSQDKTNVIVHFYPAVNIPFKLLRFINLESQLRIYAPKPMSDLMLTRFYRKLDYGGSRPNLPSMNLGF